MPKKKVFQSAKDILLSNDFFKEREKSAKYVTKEFQDYGYRLALALNDLEHKSLYIKLAKEIDRNLLQTALSFSKDYPKAKNKGKIFMWKLSELKRERKEKAESEQNKQMELF